MLWTISARRLFAWHLLLILALAVANVVTALADGAGEPSQFFRMAFESNLPTFCATLALLATALVAWRLATTPNLAADESRAWMVFAALFSFMTLDEAAQVHEKLNSFGDRTAGMFSSIGVFPYALVALTLGVWLFRFWLRQKPLVRLGLASGGLIYVFSAVGLEMVQNAERAVGTSQSLPKMLALVTGEETGEMIAVAIFLRTFLGRLAELGERDIARISLTPADASTAP
ncbi:hypothetical protein [Phenylobacterium sp.]|uniref:hypothetical protein n=1 Tax=Phenylobacterium sp. TaxID=1871053 RepID=UPI0027353227|nr:hypothetical protein [Phenylobacterium sp.]MDP3854538.1 hypothetical protein [Phenylobacterium sp.]